MTYCDIFPHCLLLSSWNNPDVQKDFLDYSPVFMSVYPFRVKSQYTVKYYSACMCTDNKLIIIHASWEQIKKVIA